MYCGLYLFQKDLAVVYLRFVIMVGMVVLARGLQSLHKRHRALPSVYVSTPVKQQGLHTSEKLHLALKSQTLPRV